MTPKTFGKQLLEIRTTLGLSQTEVAEAAEEYPRAMFVSWSRTSLCRASRWCCGWQRHCVFRWSVCSPQNRKQKSGGMLHENQNRNGD